MTMATKKKAAKRVTKKRKPVEHPVIDWPLVRHENLVAEFHALQTWIREHLRTIEHKLVMDEASRSDMRALRDALVDTRRAVEYNRGMGR